jgi:predicted O-methyltransferase YrrM
MTVDAKWSLYEPELHRLADLLVRAPRGLAIEVGCYRGRTTAKLAAMCAKRGTALLAVDPWCDVSGDETYNCFLENTREFHNLVVMRLRSDEVLPFLPAGRAGFVFVDGDHSYGQTLRDLENGYRLLGPGGILAVHDIFSPAHPGAGRAFTEFTRGGASEFLRYKPSTEEQALHSNDSECGLGWIVV